MTNIKLVLVNNSQLADAGEVIAEVFCPGFPPLQSGSKFIVTFATENGDQQREFYFDGYEDFFFDQDGVGGPIELQSVSVGVSETIESRLDRT